MPVYINAIIIRINSNNILVRDLETNQEILVHFRNSRQFRPGERVEIEFNGQMTHSIPPQITATSIKRIQQPAPPAPTPPSQSRPTEIRVTILQVRQNSLLVRDMSNNRQLVVNTRHANHFCRNQRIVVTYDVIIMSNPPEINAIDITSLC